MKYLLKLFAGTMALLTFLNASIAGASENETGADVIVDTDWSFGAFPVLFYSDETRFALGGGSQVMLGAENERFTSSLGIMAFYTQNRQYTLILAPELYFNDGRYKLAGSFGYSYFPDSFYGIGNASVKDDEEKYTGRLCKINPVLQRRISSNLFAGIQYDHTYGNVIEREDDGQLARGLVPGGDGGHASGAGVNLTWDSRDNNVYPFSGSYHQFMATSYGSVLGSDYEFTSIVADLRHYRRMFGSHVIALQGVGCVNTGRPSFQYMNEVGSLGKYLRGYTKTLFVDRNVLAFQAEYRMPLRGRFGLVGFAGFGQVADTLGDVTFDAFKPSAGVGVRFALIPEQKVNLRVDMGVGEGDGSFDISLMEAF